MSDLQRELASDAATSKAALRARCNEEGFRLGNEAERAALDGQHALASQLYHRAGTIHGLAASDVIRLRDLAALGVKL